MGLVRYYQHLCTYVGTTDCDGSDKVDNSPMKLRARKPVNYSLDHPIGSPSQPPSTPFQPPGAKPPLPAPAANWLKTDHLPGTSSGLPTTPQGFTAGLEALNLNTPPRRKTVSESNYSSNPETEPDSSPEKCRAIKDEQIVNTALIILLNLLTLAFEKDTRGDWSLYRQPFCVRDRNMEKVFKACVDGVYTIGDDILSIVEVKPYSRPDNPKAQKAVSMQETAQMASWISQFPPEGYAAAAQKSDKTGDKEITYRRLLLSQDRHQIFVTVASFNATYVKYIRDETTAGELSTMLDGDKGFLRMVQEGPFNVDSRQHMALLGKLLLAYLIQGCLLEI